MSLFATIPASLTRFILGQLHRALPPLRDDMAEERELRDLVAKVAIARLTPMNTAEALLAVQAVAAEAHASDCLQSVGQFRDDFARVAQCRAQSALMIRQAMQLRKELRLVQEERRTAEHWWGEMEAIRAEVAGATDHQTDAPKADVARLDPVQPDPSQPDPVQTGIPQPDVDVQRFARNWLKETKRSRSHIMGQSSTSRSNETKSPSNDAPVFNHETGLAVLAALALASARSDHRRAPEPVAGIA